MKVQEKRDSKPFEDLLLSNGSIWDRCAGCFKQCRNLMLLLTLGVVFFYLGFSGLASSYLKNPLSVLLDGLFVVGGFAVLIKVVWSVWRDYIEPLTYLRHWVLHMRGGDLSARIPTPQRSEFFELAQDLNSLGEMLQSLSRDTEQQLQHHTEYIAHKTRSLSLLYDVAASINISRDLNDLLTRFLHTLTEVVGARAAAVRLVTDDGEMRLVASIGLDEDMVERERVLPTQSCLCGQAKYGEDVLVQEDMHLCSKRIGRPFFNGSDVMMLAVPLQYQERTLGVYNLYVDKESFEQREDLKDLFTTIGRHLGMSIDKARLDEESKRLSLVEERTRLAHELHDSLAQTLASIRFQVRVLDETLHQGDEAAIWQELERIENSVDEANTELRELIAHFRAPIDKRGLIPSIERIIDRFRKENEDVHVFLQKEWPQRRLSTEFEVHVLRVVQEALTNIRKHAKAHTVRVMMSGDEQGNYRVLIEDDGVGMLDQSESKAPGERVGLSIMKDRAHAIGGSLQIESEPGEGVRTVLTFRHPEAKRTSFQYDSRLESSDIARTRH